MKPAVAVKAVKELGMTLVYPLNNSKEIPNLWHVFYPRSRMSWEWDEGGDDRVANLWYLRSELSRRSDIAYLKLFQNRATFCSLPVFEAFFAAANLADPKLVRLSAHAREALDLLLDNSPTSTKLLRKNLQLGGKFFESTWQRAMRELWHRGLIVGHGEFDDGAFPSLGIGASQLLFEDSVRRARLISRPVDAWKKLTALLGADSPFLKYLRKIIAA